MKRANLGCLLLALLGPEFALAQIKLPPTPVREVTEEFFGTKVTDPYRWLENTSDPEVVAWLKAQNAYTREVLSEIPGRAQLLHRINSLDNAGDVVSALQVWGGHYFYLKTEPGSDNRKLYVRDRVNAPERLLVDAEKLTTPDGKHFSIDYFQPSLDGKYVAYGLSPGGSEDSVLHVLEAATGRPLLEDGKSFFMARTRAEFGTVKEPDGFKALYAMDAYQHVKPNAYPAVLLTAGVNDPRVAPWQATKMTARLQALDHQRKVGALARGLRCGAWLWLDQVPTRQRASRRTVLFVLAVWRVGLPTYKMTTLGTNG